MLKPKRGTQINTTNPLSKEFISLMSLNEGTGNIINDLSGNKYNAINLGCTWKPTSWLPYGTSLDFAAGAEKLESIARRLPIGPNDPWTIYAIVEIDTYISLANIFGFGLQLPNDGGGPNAEKNRYILEFNNNYYFWGGTIDWDTGIGIDVDSLIHHIVFTCDGTNLRFYRDGILRAGPQVIPYTQNAGNYITSGSGHNAVASSWDGRLVTGIIYNRALRLSEIKRNYFEPFYMFDESDGICKVAG
ncbi:MAG: hypothetical protein AMJ79_11870 [Phycisphaerae bacterium SM23_30]|nr:MAG: hypothetical protein AMJ79_11870 [Phycisphaerae bacterium SM23_30]